MVLENIDNNNNKQIDTQELSNALANWFFDKTENIDEIKKQLNSYTGVLAQSLRKILEEQYKEIMIKTMKTEQEKKIIILHNKLFLPNILYSPLIKNNITIENKNEKPPLPNLLHVEFNNNIEFNNIIERARNQNWTEYTQLVRNIENQHARKSKEEINDYIKYESVVRAIGKYYEELSKENNNLLKKHGFYSTGTIKDDLWRDQKVEMFGWRESFACSQLFKYLETIKYTEYEKDQNIVSTYNQDLEKILKNNGYLWNNLFQKHTIAYESFRKEAEQIAKENKYNESLQYLSEHSEPEGEEDVEIYMNYIENTLQYSEQYSTLTKKYGPKMIEWYERTVAQIKKLQVKSPNFLPAMGRISEYNQKKEKEKQWLNISDDTINRYINYTNEANASIYTLQKRCNILAESVYAEILWNTENNYIFPAVKKSIERQKEHQQEIDSRRNKIKGVIPKWYYVVSTIAWAWNGLVDATVSVWTGIWVLITSLYRDQHQTIANVDRATKRNNFFKIGYSSAQLEPPVRDGSWNLNFDNGTVQLWSWVANMLVLLSWAWIVWKWAVTAGAKIWLKVTESVWRKAWLFTRASMQGLPNTFQEYIGAGINKSDAWKYALWTTLLTSSLEMIAPNDMFFKNPSIKWVLMQLWKEKGTQVIAKVFIKNISKEIIEEIWQESLQLIVGRIINKNINDIQSTNLETGLTWADFWTTAILTALTTGLVSSKWSLNMAKNTMNHTRTIQWIVEDKQRYVDYASKLQGIIDGKVDMEIDVEQAEIILDKIKDVNILMQKEKDNIIQKEIKWETTIEKVDNLIKTSELEYEKCKKIIEEMGSESNALQTIIAPLKGRSRILDKVQNEYWWKVEKITDVVRSTLLYDNINQLRSGFYTIVKHPSVKQIKYKNRLNNENSRHAWCRDMLINIELDSWFVFEIQLHIPEILKAKDPGLFSTLNLENTINKDPYVLTQEMYNLSEIWKEWNPIDHNILKILQKQKTTEIENSIILTDTDKQKDINKRKKKNLPKNEDKVAWHDIYDIIRELPTNDIDFKKGDRLKNGIQFSDIKEITGKLNNVQNAVNKKAIRDYNNRTKNNYDPNTFIL